MARLERMRQEVPGPVGADEIARRAAEGWKLVAIEWERETEEAERAAEEVPYGLQVNTDAARLEENPKEQEALFLMMEMTVEDGPYSAIAQELNHRGYRTRQGASWTAISVFQMLPRLIEVAPRIFATREWQQRRGVGLGPVLSGG